MTYEFICIRSYYLFPFLTHTPLTGQGIRTQPDWSGQPNAP
jgi:hypothetical protein